MKRALARYWFFINLYHGSKAFMKNILHRSLDFLPVRPGIPTLRLELLGQTCRKTFSIFCLLMLWSKTRNLFCFLKYYKAHVMTLKTALFFFKYYNNFKTRKLIGPSPELPSIADTSVRASLGIFSPRNLPTLTIIRNLKKKNQKWKKASHIPPNEWLCLHRTMTCIFFADKNHIAFNWSAKIGWNMTLHGKSKNIACHPLPTTLK